MRVLSDAALVRMSMLCWCLWVCPVAKLPAKIAVELAGLHRICCQRWNHRQSNRRGFSKAHRGSLISQELTDVMLYDWSKTDHSDMRKRHTFFPPHLLAKICLVLYFSYFLDGRDERYVGQQDRSPRLMHLKMKSSQHICRNMLFCVRLFEKNRERRRTQTLCFCFGALDVASPGLKGR